MLSVFIDARYLSPGVWLTKRLTEMKLRYNLAIAFQRYSKSIPERNQQKIVIPTFIFRFPTTCRWISVIHLRALLISRKISRSSNQLYSLTLRFVYVWVLYGYIGIMRKPRCGRPIDPDRRWPFTTTRPPPPPIPTLTRNNRKSTFYANAGAV